MTIPKVLKHRPLSGLQSSQLGAIVAAELSKMPPGAMGKPKLDSVKGNISWIWDHLLGTITTRTYIYITYFIFLTNGRILMNNLYYDLDLSGINGEVND